MGWKIPDKITAIPQDNDLVPFDQGGILRKSTWQKIKEYMLGAATLKTTSQEVIGAVNELKETSDSHTTELENHTAQLSDTENNDYGIRPLATPSPDGYNQPYHPSVVYIPEKFAGYLYWMVQSPFPIGSDTYRDKYEYPCVYASNDGINWIVPVGFHNPLDDLTDTEVSNEDFFSDPHIVYRSDLGRLEVWYRITRRADTTYPGFTLPTWLLRKTTTNGVDWSEREVMNNFQDESSGLYDMARSQALFYDITKSCYRMWYIDGVNVTQRNVGYSESIDGLTWTKKVICNLTGEVVNVWHMDLQYVNQTYHLISYERNQDSHTGIGRLTYWISTDGINFTFKQTILEAVKNNVSFYRGGLYRSCACYNGIEWKLYVTCDTGIRTYLGLMKGSHLTNLKWYNANFEENKIIFNRGFKVINDKIWGKSSIQFDSGIIIQFENENGNYVDALKNDETTGAIILGSQNEQTKIYGSPILPIEFTSALAIPNGQRYSIYDVNGTRIGIASIGIDNNMKIGDESHAGETILVGGVQKNIRTETITPRIDNTYDVGSNDHYYKNGYFKGFVKVGANSTTNRPTTNLIAGAMFFDTTLNKPIWYNGTVWVDSTGTTV